MKGLGLLLSLLLLSGCVAGLPKSGPAVVELVTQGETANNGVGSTKRGMACAQSILGLVAFGDASVAAAKRQGGITNVSSMSREITGFNVYFLRYAKSCTIINGT